MTFQLNGRGYDPQAEVTNYTKMGEILRVSRGDMDAPMDFGCMVEWILCYGRPKSCRCCSFLPTCDGHGDCRGGIIDWLNAPYESPRGSCAT